MTLRKDLDSVKIINNIVNLYTDEHSATEIAKKYNTVVSTIHRRLRSRGIEIRGLTNCVTSKTKEKCRKHQLGKNNSMYRGTKLSGNCEECGKTFGTYRCGRDKIRFCSNKCAHKKMPNFIKGKFGRNHPGWKEIKKVTLKRAVRSLHLYNEWRKSVFSRDNYICQDCGIKGCYLEAHHKIPLYQILEENNINTFDDVFMCKKLWDIDNGITYCSNCHIKNDPYRGKRKMKENKQLIEKIVQRGD